MICFKFQVLFVHIRWLLEANMVFGIRANLSFRAVNLFIYLVFTTAVKLNFFRICYAM